MNEDEARAWINDRFGAAGEARMALLASLVTQEALRQNMVSPSTLPIIWSRHIADSAQLLPLAEATDGKWLDIGSGAGFPGLVVAALSTRETILVEPRKRRASFLTEAASALGVADKVTVICGKIETVNFPAAIISARAVGSLANLFGSAIQCSRRGTVWLLPKGKTAREEVAIAQQTWHGMFHVEHSVTDPDSLIVLAKGVSRR